MDADIVIPVPDSGVPAALGIPKVPAFHLRVGSFRNHYVGRTFIEPGNRFGTSGSKSNSMLFRSPCRKACRRGG